MKKYVPIIILMAMKSEAEIVAKALDLELTTVANTSYMLYKGKNVFLFVPGLDTRFKINSEPVSRVGKTAMASLTTYVLAHYDCDIIINTGTAAGFARYGATIGALVAATSVMNHDIAIPLEGYDHYGRRRIDMRTDILKDILSVPFITGVVSTGESFTTTPEQLQLLQNEHVLAKDMEAAAFVEAISLNGYSKEVLVLKSVTDLADTGDRPEDFIANFTQAMETLTKALQKLTYLYLTLNR